MDELVGKRYATALFEVALEKQELDKMESDIQTVLHSIKENPEFIQILLLPNIMVEKKKSLLKEAFEQKINKDLMSLLLLTVDKARQGYIEKILEVALHLILEEKGILTAHITSAVELTAEEKEAWMRKLEAQTNKKIALDCKVDSSLIGGMIVRIKDQILDNSIKGELHRLAKQLYTTKIND